MEEEAGEDPSVLSVIIPGEIVQEIIFDLITKSGITYNEAIKVLGFVTARLLYGSTETPEIAGIIMERIPAGIRVAYEQICLANHGLTPGKKPN
jgi:hypothetical protein